MIRPGPNSFKRFAKYENYPRKQQRLFNLQSLGECRADRHPQAEGYEMEYKGQRRIRRGKFYVRGQSGIPYIEYRMKDGKVLDFLVDTGANKNFICPSVATSPVALSNPFYVKSAGGTIAISRKITGQFFKSLGNNSITTFYVLSGLDSFHGIIGDDTLRAMGAVIDRKDNVLLLKPGVRIRLMGKTSLVANLILDLNIPESARTKLKEIIKTYGNLFQPISQNEMVKTSIRAEIKTTTDEPIYSKGYPYPAGMRVEVSRQVEELVRRVEGVIFAPNSPYNSPIWVVPKNQNLPERNSIEL